MIENFKHRCKRYAIPKYLINRTAASAPALEYVLECRECRFLSGLQLTLPMVFTIMIRPQN